jgi:tripartite-type tricarboxylate transporter receptor subunit TctC
MQLLKKIGVCAGYAALVAASATGTNAMAQATAFPTKPVKIVVPFPPGGGNDAFARHVGQMLTDSWKQQVIIENRPGAGGNIGTSMAAKSPADGYTLLLGHTGTMSINPGLYAKLPYDPQKDFVPVAAVASTPLLLVVHPGVKVNSLKDLIALAKAKPTELNYASSGNGTGAHLAGELLKSMAKIEIMHVPYKGTGPATADLLGGQVQMSFGVIPTVLPHVKAGALKAIAVTGPSRLPSLPNVPTMAEAGLPGYESTLTYGILAPAGTPEPIVKEINAQITRAVATPKLKELLAAEGATTLSISQAQYAALIKAEAAKWDKVIKDGGIKPE